MDSKAARNTAKAAEYKLIIEKNKELIRERVISYSILLFLHQFQKLFA